VPGHSKTATARSIVAKLNSFKDREAILKRARERRPQGLFFNEDFSKKVIETRKRLQPELQRHREAGRVAYLSFNRLIVRDKPQQQTLAKQPIAVNQQSSTSTSS
jgi:hypothetical protein